MPLTHIRRLPVSVGMICNVQFVTFHTTLVLQNLEFASISREPFGRQENDVVVLGDECMASGVGPVTIPRNQLPVI